MFRCVLLAIAAGWCVGPASADEGQPLAVRVWPDQFISIESHWGLRLGIRLNGRSTKDIPVPADQVVSMSERLGHVMLRAPNSDLVSWLPLGESKTIDPNQITVKSMEGGALQISVDGVCIVVANSDSKIATEKKTEPIDVLFVSQTGAEKEFDASTNLCVGRFQPRIVLPIGFDAVKGENVQQIAHNTLAVAATEATELKRRVVILGDQPWQMPEEFEKLFIAMEKACAESQDVFAKLTVEQMNFRPANGSHTPRWNAEHMMGRQLLFFSQVYHSVDPTIQIMNLNPKQMPAQYVFAHKDWTGAEEARQLQRVNCFCRRFAYLLDGMKVTDKAKGTTWRSLQALLVQMERHYQEHTANTVKKFDLPDWPAGDRNEQ
jgi:hypothetical protein